LRRHLTSFNRYSLPPSLLITLEMETLLYSVGRRFLVFSNVKVTLAWLLALTLDVPLKIRLLILCNRSSLLFVSPNTHLIASITFDFPLPLGPMIPMTSSEKLNTVSFLKLLKPLTVRDDNLIACKCRRKRANWPYVFHKSYSQLTCWISDSYGAIICVVNW